MGKQNRYPKPVFSILYKVTPVPRNNFITSPCYCTHLKDNSFAAMLRLKLRYFLSRLIVLYVALHVLNISIDVDHLTYNAACTGFVFLDDIDSIAELLVEFIAEDNRYVTDHNNDNPGTSSKAAHKIPGYVVLIAKRISSDIPVYQERRKSVESCVFNTSFEQEDFSFAVAPPPKSILCTA